MGKPLGVKLIVGLLVLNGVGSLLSILAVYLFISTASQIGMETIAFPLALALLQTAVGVVYLVAAVMIEKLKKTGYYLGVAMSAIGIVLNMPLSLSFDPLTVVRLGISALILGYLLQKRKIFVN